MREQKRLTQRAATVLVVPPCWAIGWFADSSGKMRPHPGACNASRWAAKNVHSLEKAKG